MEQRNPIRLLIADDNLEICDILTDFFLITSEVEVCGVAHDGEEALFRIAQTQPDVVLLDLIMPKVDGLSVLERLANSELEKRPRVIVATAIGQEGFTRAALKLGADYYMIKPYDLTDLLSRVQLVASLGGGEPALPKAKDADPTPLISRAVMELGVSAHMLGYQYIIGAVCLLLREGRPCSIVKDVYATLALDFETTAECVEGAIRKAVRRAFTQNPDHFRALLGTVEDSPPANGRLLTTLAERVRQSKGGYGT